MTTWYERNREKVLAQRKARYHGDAEYRKRVHEYNKEWRSGNAPRMREFRSKWEQKTPAWSMYHNSKRRASELGIPFTIKFTDIIIPTHCPVFGFEFDYSIRELSPSLDRIIPDLGYTKENIRVISMRANRIKSDGTAEEHRKIASYIEN